MLVLTRKPQETIRIGDDICITVVSVEGGVVKIGIEAPPHVPVHRGEVYQRILEENRIAARSAAGQSARRRARLEQHEKARETWPRRLIQAEVETTNRRALHEFAARASDLRRLE